MLLTAKFHPAVGAEVVVIDHPVAVESEQIIFGCADLDELRQCASFLAPRRLVEAVNGRKNDSAVRARSPSGEETTVARDPDRRGHDA